MKNQAMCNIKSDIKTSCNPLCVWFEKLNDRLLPHLCCYCWTLTFFQVIAANGTAEPYKRFKCQIYVLRKEEGGRHSAFYQGYKPQFIFNTADISCSISFPEYEVGSFRVL